MSKAILSGFGASACCYMILILQIRFLQVVTGTRTGEKSNSIGPDCRQAFPETPKLYGSRTGLGFAGDGMFVHQIKTGQRSPTTSARLHDRHSISFGYGNS